MLVHSTVMRLVVGWRPRYTAACCSELLHDVQEARELIENARGGGSAPARSFDEALQAVRRSSCNCYPFEVLDNDSVETRVRSL
jgi:hypothetical protein